MNQNNILYFATTNNNKYEEVKNIFTRENIHVNLVQDKYNYYEIQDDSIENIAKMCAKIAVKKINGPLIIDDSGLFIEALNNFPGSYSSYVLTSIGVKGILKLMRGVTNRSAYFKTVIAYCEPSMDPIVFTGNIYGTISSIEKGNYGFGYDSIFNYNNKTLSEITISEKNDISSRSKAINLFIKWYKSNKYLK